MQKLALILTLILLLSACAPASPTPVVPTAPPTASPLTGPYVGQTPPGAEPARFGLGFMAGSFHSAPAFTPDGSEVFWAGSYGEAKIYTSRLEDGAWTKPASIAFSDKITSYRDPFVSPDGSQLFFISTQPIPGAASSGKENIWVMNREGDSWSEPQPLPEVINALPLHWTFSVAANGNLYYSARNGEFPDIYRSDYVDGAYTEPVLLDAVINTDQMENTPNIAPDESYLVFSRTKDPNSTPFMFISYATTEGWTEPQKVENVPYCISPVITPDRKYVIYLASPSMFGWRDTSFVEELRP